MSDTKKKDILIQHVKGSGPGGQNRNKRQTGIVVTHEPTGIRVRSTERRSQNQNLSDALDRLETKLEKHFYVPPRRKPTRASKASKHRRLEGKKVRSSIKKGRGRVRNME